MVAKGFYKGKKLVGNFAPMETYLYAISAIFSMVNPLGAVPVFLALTEGDPAPHIKKQIRRASFYMLGIMLIFFFGGTFILKFFGTSCRPRSQTNKIDSKSYLIIPC